MNVANLLFEGRSLNTVQERNSHIQKGSWNCHLRNHHFSQFSLPFHPPRCYRNCSSLSHTTVLFDRKR